MRASSEGRDITILTDENLNILDDFSNTSYLKNNFLKEIRDSNIIDFSLTYHNNKPTFFRKGVSSCIDFIISNCPSKISNVRTHYNDRDEFGYYDVDFNNIMSDHVMLSCHYNDNNISIPQQFRSVRNNRLLTKHALNEYFECNDRLNELFSYTDPNQIAEILIGEITVIIESIAPSKRVQCKSSYAPWLNDQYIYE